MYSDDLAIGQSFELFLQLTLSERFRLPVTIYSSKEKNFSNGDLCIGGVDAEVKFDRLWRQTGNLFVEIATTTRYGDKIRSGIFNNSTATCWLIGDEKQVFQFTRQELQNVYRDEFRYRTVLANLPDGLGRNRGFLLPITHEICKSFLTFDK